MNADCVVVGLGAMGAAAVYHMARRGGRVIGLDQYTPPHSLGSTQGESRVTRQAIGEGAAYVPFVLRSHELWRELEAETGRTLLTQNGGLILAAGGKTAGLHGKPNFFEQTLRTAEAFHIPHERLTAADINARFPAFSLSGDERGYYEPGAGFVRPEACVEAQLERAKSLGAVLAYNEQVLEILPQPSGRGVTIRTEREVYRAEKVIVGAGAWVSQLLPSLRASLSVYRQVMYWFRVRENPALFSPERFPVFIWEQDRGGSGIYGFPALNETGDLVKAASETYLETTTPETVDRSVSEAEIEAMHRQNIAPFFPALSTECAATRVCLYTAAPDARFLLDALPEFPQVFVASPCSGHGFKHSAAIGEALAQWAAEEKPTLDRSEFRFPSVLY